MKNSGRRILAVAGLDRRSIGLFRIALGIYIAYHTLTLRLLNFGSFYSISTGFFPKDVLQSGQLDGFLSSDLNVIILMALSLMGALGLVIGYKVRLSALMVLVIYSYFNLQYQHVTFGWDRYIEALLLLAAVLPTARWSMFKGAESEDERAETNYTGPFLWLALLQIALIYGVAGIGKNGALWMDGSAAGILLRDDLLTFFTAGFFSGQQWFVKLMSYGTIAFECLIPILLFWAGKNGKGRMIAGLMIIAFHWGIGCFMDVGHFKYAGILSAILLLPTAFWQRFSGWESRLNAFFRPRFTDRLPFSTPSGPWLRPMRLGLFAFLAYGMLSSNFYLLTSHPDAIGKFCQKRGIDRVARLVYQDMGIQWLYFHQNWYLYAPNPTIGLGKLYFVGIRTDGKKVDLETGRSFQPDAVTLQYDAHFADLTKFYHTKLRNYANKNTKVDRIIDYAYYQAGRWKADGKPALKGVVVYNHYLNAYEAMQGSGEGYEMKVAIEIDL